MSGLTTSVTSDLVRSTRAELLRVRKAPATWVVLGAWLALNVMFAYLFNYVAYATGSTSFATEGATRESLLADLLPAALPEVLVLGMPMWGAALMMVLGALVAGSGFGWGTWKTVFTQGPTRTRALAGSLVALTALVLVVTTTTLLVDLGLALTITAVESQPLAWPALADTATSFGSGLLLLTMWAYAGFLLGVLARGAAVSVGFGLVWALVVENLLRGVGSLLTWMDTVTTYLPGTAGGSLVGSLVDPQSAQGVPGVLDTLSRTEALATMAAYLVLLPSLAVVLMRRRDLV